MSNILVEEVRLTLAILHIPGTIAQECLQHIMFSPRHSGKDDVGGLVCEKVINGNRFLLRLSMYSSSNLPLILRRPRLILHELISKALLNSKIVTHQEYKRVRAR